MQVGPTFTSRTAPATDPYEVGREKIREFAAALGETDPVHTDPEAARAAGYPDVIAPPTFLVGLTLRSEAQVAEDLFGAVDMADILHREQAFTHARPVRAGDRLVVSSTVECEPLDERFVLSLRTDVSTVEGEHVCLATSVMVYSGALAAAGTEAAA